MFSKSFKHKLKSSSTLHQNNKDFLFHTRFHGTYHIIVISSVAFANRNVSFMMIKLLQLKSPFIRGKMYRVVNAGCLGADNFIRPAE